MTLLQKRDAARKQRRLELCQDTRTRLRIALGELIPGCKVILFGSLTKPGVFNERSDVDLALPEGTAGVDAWQLTAELSKRLSRRVDVLWLRQCRFRQKILREGEVWTT